MKLLRSILLLCLSSAVSSEPCSWEDVVCLAPDGTSCEPSATCQPSGTVLLALEPAEEIAYVYKNESVAIKFTVAFHENVTNQSIITTNPYHVNSSHFVEGVDNGTPEIYFENITYANKSMEGKYTFEAFGSYSGEEIHATGETELYVYTLRVELEQDFYAFKKEINSLIGVTIHCEAQQLSRVKLYEQSPTADKEELPLQNDIDPYTYRHSFQIPTPINGRYTFIGEEYSPYGGGSKYYNSTVETRVHVLTTYITSPDTSYFAPLGNDLSIPLTVETEVTTPNHFWVRVKLLDGTTENITISDSGFYNVSDITNDNLGDYEFSAYESVDGHGDHLSSRITISVYNIKIATDLQSDGASHYTATKGENHTITCFVDGAAQNLTWLDDELKAVPKDTTSEFYQDVTATSATLHIRDIADYRISEDFTCSSAESNITLFLSIEGPPISSLEYDARVFTCNSNGNPRPDLTWTMGDAPPPSSVFDETRSDVGDFAVTSTLTVKVDTLCLGDQQITCAANNAHDTVKRQKSLNTGNVTAVFKDEYIIYHKVDANFGNASETCNGGLVTLKTEEKKEFLTSRAEVHGIGGFYVGVTKNETGHWVYADGTDATPDVDIDNSTSSDFSCLRYYDASSEWKLDPCSCDKPIYFACEVKDYSAPKSLRLDPDECDGSLLNVTWSPPLNATVALSQASTVESKSVNGDSLQIDNLQPSTEYIVTVYGSQPDYCILYPQESDTVTTTGPAAPPQSVGLTQNDQTQNCTMTWDYQTSDAIDGFTVTITSNAEVDEKHEFNQTSLDKNLAPDTATHKFHMVPNTVYNTTIYSRSCAGNSTLVHSNATCVSPIGKPLWVYKATGTTASGANGEITTTLPVASNRYGPVRCQFLVVHYYGKDEILDTVMNESRFGNIKQYGDDVAPGEEYFAYATEPLAKEETYTLGKGKPSSCTPLPNADSQMARRSVSDEVNAWNRPIPYGQRISVFMVKAVVDEENSLSYVAMSEYDPPTGLILEQRAEPESSNAAVIVLSILAAIIAIGLLFFLFRRCRRPTNRPRFLQFSYSANSEHVYDTL